MAVRCIVFRIHEQELPRELVWLLGEFRLMANKAIRTGLENCITSRYVLCKAVYKQFREEHSVYSQYIPSVCEVAASILKNHRRRVRKGLAARIPYVRRLMLNCENQAYRLDRGTGILTIPIRAREHVEVRLPIGSYHRRYLDDKELKLGSLTICPDKVIVAFRKENVPQYIPETVIAIDTNERSLDGVFVEPDGPLAVRWDLSETCVLQERYHERRKRLQTKKAHDRRTCRRLCSREGKREHGRIENRLHEAANRLVRIAEVRKSAIVLEDLTGFRLNHRSKNVNLNRRLSSWPRRKLHQYIEYKAEWAGVPVIKVDPGYTSRTCPVCGRIDKDSRKDRVFRCACGWECDRHVNAGLNILEKAMASNGDVARAVQGRPDASWHDPMRSLYDLRTGARTEANGMSGAVG